MAATIACHFPGRGDPGPPLVVQNGAATAINVYLVGRSRPGVVFLGRVGSGKSHTFRIRGTAPGDTVSLQARPIDGAAVSAQTNLVLGQTPVWPVP